MYDFFINTLIGIVVLLLLSGWLIISGNVSRKWESLGGGFALAGLIFLGFIIPGAASQSPAFLFGVIILFSFLAGNKTKARRRRG